MTKRKKGNRKKTSSIRFVNPNIKVVYKLTKIDSLNMYEKLMLKKHMTRQAV